MAGAGYKSFTSGDILTASDTNTYLMQQTIMTFASAAARTTALTAPSEGMFSYLVDSDAYFVYSGSAWMEFDIVWKSYTPTIAGVTLGSGYTLSASYAQLGELMVVNFYFALGATSAITGDVSFSLPVNQASSNRSGAAGTALIYDASPGVRYPGTVYITSTPGYAFVRALNSAGTYLTAVALTSAIPIAVWATSDSITANISYEVV